MFLLKFALKRESLIEIIIFFTWNQTAKKLFIHSDL